MRNKHFLIYRNPVDMQFKKINKTLHLHQTRIFRPHYVETSENCSNSVMPVSTRKKTKKILTHCIKHQLDNIKRTGDLSPAAEVIQVEPQRALSQQLTYVKNVHEVCNEHSKQINNFKRKQL